MKFERRLKSLWLGVGWGRCVMYAVGALLITAMTLVFPANRSELSSTRFFEAIAAISGIIIATYSVAIAIITKIEPLTDNEGEEERLLATLFTLFTFSVIIQSVTLGIILIFGIDNNSVLSIIANGLLAACLMSIADIALLFFRLKSDIRNNVQGN